MGKTSWGVLGLLFACLAHGVADPDGGHRCLATLSDFANRTVSFRGPGHGHSATAATPQRHTVRGEAGPPGDGRSSRLQTGQVDLMIGLAMTPERAQFIDYLQPAYYQCRPAFYGQGCGGINPAHLRRSAGAEGGAMCSIPFILSSLIPTTGSTSTALPTEDQLLRMVQRGHLPLMIGTDCQVDYALSQHNEAGLIKAAYQPPPACGALSGQ